MGPREDQEGSPGGTWELRAGQQEGSGASRGAFAPAGVSASMPFPISTSLILPITRGPANMPPPSGSPL